MMERMPFKSAQAIDLPTASDEQLAPAWHAFASQISYHHADDTGKEWGAASALMEPARAIEREMRRRDLPRPTGNYLMSAGDRIDWQTGEWSRGWHLKARVG